MMDEFEFRRILGHLATGVTVVAARRADGRAVGLTASAVCSVSLRPPLVLVCVALTADSHDWISASGAFAVSVLPAEEERLARRFSSEEQDRKFEGVAYREEGTGSPVLEAALAWVDCRISAEYEAGDHTIFLGEVVAGDARDGAPLIFYRGGFGRLMP
jgi:flavin reductase (DIM6/NTAB) family NADH-FMN oxidoreductase RutF